MYFGCVILDVLHDTTLFSGAPNICVGRTNGRSSIFTWMENARIATFNTTESNNGNQHSTVYGRSLRHNISIYMDSNSHAIRHCSYAPSKLTVSLSLSHPLSVPFSPHPLSHSLAVSHAYTQHTHIPRHTWFSFNIYVTNSPSNATGTHHTRCTTFHVACDDT